MQLYSVMILLSIPSASILRYNKTMIWIAILLIVFLVFVASTEPYGSRLSDFESKRRIDKDDIAALLDYRRGSTREYLLTWRQIIIAWSLVIISALLVLAEGWGFGVVWAMVISLFYGRIASIGMIRAFTKKYYDKFEPAILSFAEATRRYVKPFRSWFGGEDHQIEIGSRDELQYIINNASNAILGKDERQTILSALDFKEKRVADYMTPRSVIDTIAVDELLGPLVLDDLYKTGHSHFPVCDGDIDHIVGILHIQNLFALKNRESLSVKDIMDTQVFYVHENQSLDKALGACIKKRRSLLVVVNQYRETVGVITVEDIIEQLIGRKIIDQFDAYDDLRAVAEANPKKNNSPTNAQDV